MRNKAKEWLDCANNDLDACISLFEKEYYPQAVFLMQQAYEKTLKAELMLSGFYKERDIRDFNHDILGATRDFKGKMAEYYQWDSIEGLAKYYDKVKANRKEIIRYNYDRLKDLFSGVEKTSLMWKNELRKKGVPETTIDGSWIAYFEISIISTLLQYHESSSRYPDMGGGNLTPREYKRDLGIVSFLPDLWNKCNILIEFLYSNCIIKRRNLISIQE